MFVAVYEFEVKPGFESDFQKYWLEFTKGIYRQCGSLGSRLHQVSEHFYVGYAQWPDRMTWNEAKNIELGEEYQSAGDAMRACLVRSNTRFEMEVASDYLQQEEALLEDLSG